MSLTRSDAVIALGKRLVVCLRTEDDLLGGWMAHHLAALITAAETASPETRAATDVACAAAVLEVWRHRNTLPQHLRPLGELEPILATLATLSIDPGSSRYHPETLRSAALAKTEGETKQWLELAIGLDHTARVLIGSALRAAAACADDSVEGWVDLARRAGEDEGREEAFLSLLNPYRDAQQTSSLSSNYKLEDQLRRLRSFTEMANTAADDIQSRLDSRSED